MRHSIIVLAEWPAPIVRPSVGARGFRRFAPVLEYAVHEHVFALTCFAGSAHLLVEEVVQGCAEASWPNKLILQDGT